MPGYEDRKDGSVMNDDSGRYSRQIRLAEVGEAGQERICRCAVEARGRDGALVELAYLERAGVGAVELRPLDTPVPFRHAGMFRFDEIGRASCRERVYACV